MMLRFSFTDRERECLNQLHAISIDTSESEVLVGLTPEETAFYMEFTRKYLAGERNYHNLTRYLDLHDRHEAARLRALGMARYLQQPTPLSAVPSWSQKESLVP
jgi:hypothetical protein